MGRPSKPTSMLRLEGSGHRTKAELEYREAAEKALQSGATFEESPEVMANSIAHAEFVRLQALYAKIDYVDALDQQIINRYCLELAQVTQLEQMLEQMRARIDGDKALTSSELVQLYKAIAGIQACANQSKGLLLKYEDRLFLNPATRIKAVPKSPPEAEELDPMAVYLAKHRAEREGRKL